MSRITKWKLEKAKVKVVFRLQFHATHIPQTGWDKLFISFIPADSGKTTAKTTKANVRNGICKWADPIYETTRLLQDVKSKQYDEKLYKLVVAMGSSRSSLLGEATINLADYVDALKPSAVALPLHGCSSGTILHVAVQLLTSKTGFREFEQQRELRERGLQTGAFVNRHEESFTAQASSSEDANDQVNAKVRFGPEFRRLPSLEEEVRLNEEFTDSATGFDGSSNTSESLYAEKHDTFSSHEIDSLKSTISGDLNGQSPQTEKGDPSHHQNMAQGSSDSVHGWVSDYSVDNDLVSAYEDDKKLRGSLVAAETSIFELKLEVSSLQSHANDLNIEAQSFERKLAAEIASSEEIAKEVNKLKSESSKFRDDLERLKSIKLSPQLMSGEIIQTKQDYMIHDINCSCLKGLQVVEDKIKEIQKKAYLGFNERDFSFLHSDLEALLSILPDLKQGTTISLPKVLPPERSNVREIREIGLQNRELFVPAAGFDVDLFQEESMLGCVNIHGTGSQESDSVGMVTAMNNKVFELLRELNEANLERESLARKMDQMECYYEALVQELEESQKQMLSELQNLRNEHSHCIYTISKSKAEMESMYQDMNEQMLKYAEERRDLDLLSKELERRAVTSEAALRRARLNYSIAVDQLQKDLELLSFQVISMFDTNDNLIKQAFQENPSSFFQVDLDAEGSETVKTLQCQNQFVGTKRQLSGGNVLLGDMKKSLCLQEELYQKVVEELYEMYSENLELDVFSKILKETLLESNATIGVMKEKMNKVAEHLELSTESRNLLLVRLHTAMNDLHTLNEYKASCIAKCNDMALQNQVLEAKLEGVLKENLLLSQKIIERENLLTEYRGYESSYETCSLEKKKAETLLEDEILNNGCLQNKISSLEDELKALRSEFDELAMSKENLQDTFNVLHDKLSCLLGSYNKQLCGLPPLNDSQHQELDVTDITFFVTQLEQIQHNTCSKMVRIMQEKKDLEDEVKSTEMSLSNAKSEILMMKKKFKLSMQDMSGKLDVSSALVENLWLKIESLGSKIHISSEVEGKYALQNKDLISDLAFLEAELQNIVLKNKDFAQEIVGLDSIAQEHGRTKLENNELLLEKQDLMKSLQDKAAKFVKVASELESSKECLRCLHEELHKERGFRDMLEFKITDLTSQMNEKNDRLLQFDQQKAELMHFRQLSTDLMMSSQDKAAECVKLTSEIDNLKESLRCLHEELHKERGFRDMLECKITDLTFQLNEKNDRLLHFDQQKAELMHFRQLTSELIHSAQDKAAEFDKLASEIDSSKETLRCLDEELHNERGFRDKLECKITDLTFQLNEKNERLLHFDQQKAELMHFRRLATDLELENSRISHLVLRHEESLEKHKEESSCLTGVKSQMSEMDACVLAAEVKFVFVKTHYETLVEGLVQQLQTSYGYLGELKERHLDVKTMLESRIVSEAHYVDKNANLVKVLESLRSELEASVAQNKVLSDSNNAIAAQLEECKNKLASLEFSVSQDQNNHSLVVEQLKCLLANAEDETEYLMLSKEELEVSLIVLKAKLEEQHAGITVLEECNNELLMLRKQCNELIQKLSQQVLKTEEFKNLSIHLKELKDKADSECLQAREIREEGPSHAVQESLRIAFIKEQYETRLQEVKQQLSISKKYGDEMLWKLQDVINENENRKKSETSQLKRNEELALRILELETELQSMLSEKRDKTKAYDRVKAELECALLSLECCKEEKEKVEICLHESNEEKSRITAELTLINEQLRNYASSMNMQREQSGSLDKVNHMCSDLSIEEVCQGNPMTGIPSHEIIASNIARNGSGGIPSLIHSDQDCSLDSSDAEETKLKATYERENSTAWTNSQLCQDVLVSKAVSRNPEHALIDRGNWQGNVSNHLDVIDDRFRAQSLKSSIEHLQEELEKMKNENSFLPQDHQFDTNFLGLQEELMQLHKVNEELGSIFPLFNEYLGSGNALERVLALEIELAEALKAKKKASTHFQSSFLKQHSDEEAIFRSFRDINELIKDMLEIKGRFAAVETELKEMHDRYSQLSLQFAEVEGERQKLMMMLKNVRVSRKHSYLNRPSSDNLGSHPS